MKFKRKENPNIEKKFKRKKIFRRKKNFKRRYSPKCYVCGGVLQDLIDLKWNRDNDMDYTDAFVRLRKRAQERIVRIPSSNGTIYRHNKESCEPGGRKYMEDEDRRIAYYENLGLKGE
jgi:hypothetical protein